MKKFRITVEGKTYEVEVEELDSEVSASVRKPAPTVTPQAVSVPKKPPVAAPIHAATSKNVIAPMPGTITEVKVTAGQQVKEGDVICVLEAMKMETDIVAPHSGTIESVNISMGSKVATGDVMITFK